MKRRTVKIQGFSDGAGGKTSPYVALVGGCRPYVWIGDDRWALGTVGSPRQLRALAKLFTECADALEKVRP